ncbi:MULTISPECIES: two-component system histidine kinase PnpS [unclassified Paenibacillus]|uniref:two-component system histidine kinase PnpS n=1 Tax=unclassified Paenibacillus TaxID=185978 RepID=UPI001C10DE2F|nr:MULTISPECIES: ATP-binding protein [unclassified Paenibacillus]MBU5441595.1 PAS domain S-box protein [Paenibacillus sp. MSJ-34]CAH0117735.1 Alkaline phosphatase synthesis sensor protein PhoR [Paenibacillus sp. CECT 9249]
MRKFRVRLTVILIAIVGLSVLAAGMLSVRMFQQSHLSALEENMDREIKMILEMFPWLPASEDEAEQFAYYTDAAKQLSESTEARVTFIRSDGQVIGDSEHDPRTMENHAGREEIIAADRTGRGSQIRFSETLGHNMLYVAIPAKNPSFQGYVRLAMSINDVEADIRQLWIYLFGGLLVLFALAALVSFRIAFGLTRPLEHITKVAYMISRKNYKARVDVRKIDEIGQLGAAINTMADSLQEQMNHIRENEHRLQNVLENMINGVMMADQHGTIVLANQSAETILGLEAKQLAGKNYKDIKQHHALVQFIAEGLERKEMMRDEVTVYLPEEKLLDVNLVPMYFDDRKWVGMLVLLQDMTAIRRLERMRSEFVANVSHELKTPVAAVKGFAETLLSGAVNDAETTRAFLQIIYDESDRLNRLIGDILELSKIESKRSPLQFSPVHLQSFIDKTVEMLRTEAAKKNIALESQVPEYLFAEADEDRLRQILINVLSNGISYTPQGGKVKVTAEPIAQAAGERNDEASDADPEEYETIRITISDTGIGIPKPDLPRIFERFYRVDKARSRSSGGTGLGLSIVKHLVELHKGTIQVESELGIGTSFIIDIPVIQQQIE